MQKTVSLRRTNIASWRLSQSVINAVDPAGAEFARIGAVGDPAGCAVRRSALRPDMCTPDRWTAALMRHERGSDALLASMRVIMDQVVGGSGESAGTDGVPAGRPYQGPISVEGRRLQGRRRLRAGRRSGGRAPARRVPLAGSGERECFLEGRGAFRRVDALGRWACSSSPRPGRPAGWRRTPAL
jgi:hypothetical protein